jgi:hypothetical protein
VKRHKSKLFLLPAVLVTILIFCSAALCNFCAIPALNTSTETEENAQAQDDGTDAVIESKESISVESQGTAEKTDAADTVAQASEEESTEEAAEEPVEEVSEESGSASESSSESVAEGEAGPSESVISIAPDSHSSGTLLQDEILTGIAMAIRIGDSESNDQYKGYLSFNIDALHGKTIQDAEINFLALERYNNPGFAPYLDVKAFNYGTLDGSDFAVGGVSLARIPTSSVSYIITGDTLKNEVQKILDSAGNDYFQLKLGLSSATDNDTVSDCFFIHYNKVELYIAYLD